MSKENVATGVTHQVFLGGDQTMVIRCPKDIEQDKKLFEGVDLANRILRLELGKSQASATAEWVRVNDERGRPFLQLTLTDLFTKNQVIERFEYQEFRDRGHLETRIHQMWGNLLRARSGGLIKSLEEIINRSGG